MNIRLDTPFESWGGFSETISGSPNIHGKLQYHPEKGIELELVKNPKGLKSLMQANALSFPVLFGRLVDGTLVTLFKCFITKTEFQIGIDIGSPTMIIANMALFGQHISDIDELPVKKYILELSLLANWSSSSPIKIEDAIDKKEYIDFDVNVRTPDPIIIDLPDRDFGIQISHRVERQYQICRFNILWNSAIIIIAHEKMHFKSVFEIGWQFQNLMSLLIGKRPIIKAITIYSEDTLDQLCLKKPLELIYNRTEKDDPKVIYPVEMSLPYSSVREKFPEMVERWFSRSDQTVLATNIFFSTEYSLTPSVNDKFLSMTQALESYHRSLGTGLYIEPDSYKKAIKEIISHIPTIIRGDHRESLKKRLQYGNEYSLRKRLQTMISRIPKDLAKRITGNPKKFIEKIVDTRNYYTHYDYASKNKALNPKDAFTAAERLRILIFANILVDLGIEGENLLSVFKRNQDYINWMNKSLPL